MIKTLTLIVVFAALALAENKPAKPKVTGAAPATIPSAAVQVEPNLYRYVDTNGKVWLYSRTPFGLSIREDKPAIQSATHDDQLVTVTDLGESVRFERKTPFGTTIWVSKKSELTEGEQVMLLRAQLKNRQSSEEARPASGQEKQ
jgi:hypothetical protein